MNERQLIEIFESKGCACVYTLDRYHAIRASDIEDGKVKDDACSLVIVIRDVLDMPTDKSSAIDKFALHVGETLSRALAKNTGTPFSTIQPYQILPEQKRDLPEWRGWSAEYVRGILGIGRISNE